MIMYQSKNDLIFRYTNALYHYRCIGKAPNKTANKNVWQKFIDDSEATIQKVVKKCRELNKPAIEAIANKMDWIKVEDSEYDVVYKQKDGFYIYIFYENANFIISDKQVVKGREKGFCGSLRSDDGALAELNNSKINYWFKTPESIRLEELI